MSRTPQWVLDRIQEAKEKQSKRLELWGGLTEIPPEVFELEWLEELDLRRNKITVVPPEIQALKHLKELDLRGNALRKVADVKGLILNYNFYQKAKSQLSPQNIAGLRVRDTEFADIFSLPNLTTLDLSYNNLTSLPKSITRLENLTRLYLSWNKLTSLPKSITRLENLTEIKLNKNNLTSLPKSITRLENLTRLDLSWNQLTSLPKSITRLENLNFIDLSHNNLTSLPKSITRLENLTTLNLNGFSLTSLPESITRLENLTELNLINNQLISLPDSFWKLKKIISINLINNNFISMPNEITKLEKLTSLYLSANQLTSLPESITRLENLTKIDLRNNQLTSLPESIARLKSLKKLNLSNNKLKCIPESIIRLKNLTSLNLSNNQLISLPESITRLENLTELYLMNNNLTFIPEKIYCLENLTVINLSGNQLISLPESITRLKKLNELNLSNNQLISLPESITRLKKLNELNLSGNQLTSLPESITRLENLTKLDLSDNNLKYLQDSISSLVNLKELYLGNNNLTLLPESIARLENLIILYLSANQLTLLPESITRLENLTELYLSDNNLKFIPESIARLEKLRELYLSYNHLTSLPESITRLENLTVFYLSYNQFTSLPESVYELRSLEILNLANVDRFGREKKSQNQIKEISPKILQLTNLRELTLKDNPIETPPPEIVADGVEAIKRYFRQLEAEGEDYIYEAKLLIVGEGGGGKTSLAKKIEDQDYKLQPAEKSTEGIDVIRWQFEIKDGQPFYVNIWDFGGQEIYHATHQFFLTKRSLYILVCDTRKEDTDFYYWLSVVELLSDKSPLIIVKNEKQNRKREIPERQLRGQFTNLKETLATNLANNRGLDDILEQIKFLIQNLEHIGSELPKTWVKVRKALEEDPRNYISLKEYLELCEVNGFTERKNALQLSGYLHDLGVILHFQDDQTSLLYRTVILKPEWGTTAVYRVLDNKKVIANLGQFTGEDLAKIWHEPEYRDMLGQLLELMLKFQLCYYIKRQKLYIAPQLLSPNQPVYEWDEQNNLILRYTATEFMPKGIITHFIVAMHHLIEKQEYVWREGLILEKDNTRAEVIEHYDKREIKIRLSGQYKRDLMTLVINELDKLYKSFHRLKYSKLIPCNCDTCKGSQTPHFYDYEKLREFASHGRYQIECDNPPYQRVSVLSLIDDISDKKETLHHARAPKPRKKPNITALMRPELLKVFDAQALEDFCFDYFPMVEEKLSDGMEQNRKINLLLKHCRGQPTGYQVLLEALHQKYSNGPHPREELRPLITMLEEFLNQ